MTVSHWRLGTSGGEIGTSVCVIGGGIAGVSAALWLGRRGVDVVLVERGAIGSGASGRNAGFLMRGAADNYGAAARTFGREMARRVWSMTEQNLALLRAEGVEALGSYRRVPSCLIAFEVEEAGELRESVELLEADGFEAAWVERGEDTLWTRAAPIGALLNPGDAACNPLELLGMLRAKLNACVIEQQEVVEIRGDADSVFVRTTDAMVRASRVMVCTNAYAPSLLAALDGLVAARRGQMFAARAPGVRLDCSYYANHGSEYFRQANDGMVVVGGCRTKFADVEVGCEDVTTPGVQGALEQFASRVLGEGLEITARWAGTMGFSPDGLALVGPVEGAWAPGSVWFCGGFTGHGMSTAFVAAREAVGAMLDGTPTLLSMSRMGREHAAHG
jgi:glycine/D-amino acid oxidase-like deaminating enzyme